MISGKIRIGIDVGGTFTHAVAIDSDTMGLVGRVKVPTTHRAKEGVARGIIEALKKLLDEAAISPENVGFIAHSTTQATNALLEGDVAPVGIVAMGSGLDAWIARSASRLGKIELAPDKHLPTYHSFLNTSKPLTRELVVDTINALVKEGARAIAVSEAFSVDSPASEEFAVAIAREMGLPATAGHEVSQLYGFKVRTRTAVINASMLPKMIESADMTEASVREAGISAPVMIMRSDGGVMDIAAMRKRPILTMLSGPAAGVAAAMMFLRISDGIFLEVGGTSTDISAIKDGKAKIKSAEVGGHRVYMRTLDVRTVGIAGGSMPRIKAGKLIDVGPRSAHIAGLKYASFEEPLKQPQVRLIRPLPGDPDDYAAIGEAVDTNSATTGMGTTDTGTTGTGTTGMGTTGTGTTGTGTTVMGTAGTRTTGTGTAGTGDGNSGPALPAICVTPTCAANQLSLVPEGDCAAGNKNSIGVAFGALANKLSITSDEAATQLLSLAIRKCLPVVQALIADHKLDKELVTLVGGGGGATAIVPFLAKEMGLRFQLAEYADVISAIGVALALIRETVERQVVSPTDDDILKIRQEAHAAVEKMGADPASIEVHIEIDTRTSVVRATACGASSMTEKGETKKASGPEECKVLVAESMRVPPSNVQLGFDGSFFKIYTADKIESKIMGLLKHPIRSTRVLDHTGTIRLQFRNAVFMKSSADASDKAITTLIEEHSEWGDAGKVIPDLVLLAGPKIIDLSGLLDATQVVALAKAELETVPRDAQVVAIARLN